LRGFEQELKDDS